MPIWLVIAAEVELPRVFVHRVHAPWAPVLSLGTVAALVVAVLLLYTAFQHRRHAGATDRRLCRSCSLPHPPFARFCRRCGRALGGWEKH
jgi:hypothetical protein